MTIFRPCIDLHQGQVKQIVGGSLDSEQEDLRTNFVSDRDAAHYASMYRDDGLTGGHVIQLGPGNTQEALKAIQTYPNALQVGGGIHSENASDFLDAGASHVIVTSMMFDRNGRFQRNQLETLVQKIGKARIVIDLSCRRVENGWRVAMNRWQTITDLGVNAETLGDLANYADEYLIHAADVEGKCEGVDEELVEKLGQWTQLPCTYAGGARGLNDLERVDQLSGGHVDLTIGSALDIFGGSGVTYRECLAWNRTQQPN